MKIKAYHKGLKKWFWVESMTNINYETFTVVLVKNRFRKDDTRKIQDEIECDSSEVNLYFNI